MPIRALLMDIDDTLFDFQTSSQNALSIAFRSFALPFTQEMWARYSALDAEFWQRFERGAITKEALYVERFRVFFAEYGLKADPAAFNAAYFRELGAQRNFMPHCEQALRQLHAQYKIFIVTNGNTDIQKRRIAASGMAQYFDRVFISEQMGCKKPDKLFYDKVFAEIGEEYRACSIMIGDEHAVKILRHAPGRADSAPVRLCRFRPPRPPGPPCVTVTQKGSPWAQGADSPCQGEMARRANRGRDAGAKRLRGFEPCKFRSISKYAQPR